MNKFQFMGRLTKDPEVKYTPSTNAQITTFSIAVNRRFAGANGERQADFFNLTSFGKTSEFCSKYFKKGQQVLVVGRIQNRTWDDPNGSRKYFTDYIVEEAYFADSRKDGVSQDATSFSENAGIPSNTEDGDFVTVVESPELPF